MQNNKQPKHRTIEEYPIMLVAEDIAVEDTVPRNLYERSALDWLVYNAPLEYLELVLSGEIWDYLRKYTDDSRLDGRDQ